MPRPKRKLNILQNKSIIFISKITYRRIKDEKEREVARLRELQEKAQDRQAEIDALRAKRAREQAERQAREKDRREAEKRAEM